VQLAARAGARVTATVRNEALRTAVAEVGGAGVEVIGPVGFEARGPFDVVLELIGGPNFAGDLAGLAVGGRISILGVGGGGQAELDLITFMAKRGRIHASTLRARPSEEKATVAQRVARHVLPLLRSGAVRVPVERTFPMAEAEAAYDTFQAGGKFGKLILVPE
jgi:NADPH:quinone reductase-like Zn-dependent oxidoreductase